MKHTLLALTMAGLLPVLGYAQNLNINLDAIAAKAKEKAEITLDESLLKMAAPMVPQNFAKLSGLKSLMVRHYEFTSAGILQESDLAGLRQQISADKAWSHLVSVKDKDDNVEIVIKKDASGKLTDFLLVASEAKELTLIHATGLLELAQLKEIVNSKIAFGGVAANQ